MAPPVALTLSLQAEYAKLFASAAIRPEHRQEVATVAKRMVASWPRYTAVAGRLKAPAHVVALIHAMECGLSFSRHLHNGDPLTARTVHVPAGRPAAGKPPFSWEASALDALTMHGLDSWKDWSIPGLCYVLERYNGWGYRRYHAGTPTPYLWSFTTVYLAGKYASDGHFDPNLVSKQAGAMALLKSLADAGKPYSEVDCA